MNPMVKKALTLALLLPLTGCWDCWTAKKNNDVKSESAVQGHAAAEKSSKCSHKGCTHDHSKDANHDHNKNSHHHKDQAAAQHDEVETQGMDDDMDDMDDMDQVEVQSMDDMDDEDNMDDNY